jgi:hypothetical protein
MLGYCTQLKSVVHYNAACANTDEGFCSQCAIGTSPDNKTCAYWEDKVPDEFWDRMNKEK